MRINPASLFKAGSYILIVAAIVHLVGHFWFVYHANAEERHLMELMAAYQKRIAGGSMPMTDILHGLNVCYSLFFVFAGILNIVLTNHTADPQLLKKISVVNAYTYTLGLIISLVYFYWIPVVVFAVVTVCFAYSAIKARKQ